METTHSRDRDLGSPRSAGASHLKALLIGIGLFLALGLGLGLLGLLLGLAGDGSVPTGGQNVPIEVGSVAFFAFTAILLSPLVALAIGIAIGAADGRNPFMRGLMAGIASFIGFFVLVIATIVVSGAEIGNTLGRAMSQAQNFDWSSGRVWTGLLLSALPATAVGFLSGLLSAALWPRMDPYTHEDVARVDRGMDRGVDDRRYAAGPAYREERLDARDRPVYREDPGRYAAESPRRGYDPRMGSSAGMGREGYGAGDRYDAGGRGDRMGPDDVRWADEDRGRHGRERNDRI